MLAPSVIVCGLDGTPASVELARISSSLAVVLGARLVWDVADPIRALVQSRAKVDDGRLADPDVPLTELIPA